MQKSPDVLCVSLKHEYFFITSAGHTLHWHLTVILTIVQAWLTKSPSHKESGSKLARFQFQKVFLLVAEMDCRKYNCNILFLFFFKWEMEENNCFRKITVQRLFKKRTCQKVWLVQLYQACDRNSFHTR